MKKIYVTYLQNGQIKKAELSEDRYSQLNQDSSISEIVVYPSQILMEQNYQTKISGNLNNKRFLHG